MKASCSTIFCLTALVVNSALSQPSPTPTPAPSQRPSPAPALGSTFSDRIQNIVQQASKPSPEPTLIKFNLDFPGGTPKELLAAIEKATGRTLNAIVKDEFSNAKLPALKMTSVTVPGLFAAFELASRGSVTVGLGGGNTSYSTSYGFTTTGNPSEDSIWYFYAYKGPPPVCRFYSLATYLDRGLSVDDITTAIQTGWKMLGETSPPAISFHKDTMLLIAVGEERKLETIDAALKALAPPMTFLRGGGFGPGGSQQMPRTNSPAPAAK